MNRTIRALVGVAVIVIIGTVGGNVLAGKLNAGSPIYSSSSQEPVRPSPSPTASNSVAVGQPLELSGAGLEATVTVLSVADHAHATGPIGQPALNGQYAVADVSIKVAAGHYTYSAAYFNQAANGRTYSWTDGRGTTAGYEPGITFGSLGAGESKFGFITFGGGGGAPPRVWR